jgi:hypothetical protein
MIPYLVGVFVLGIFVGICWRNIQIGSAAKNNTVITIDGIIYSVKRWDDV